VNALEFAIAMENDAENYYTAQAEINKNNSLHTVCLMLANDEKNHARILRSKLAEKPFELEDTNTLTKAKNVFSTLENYKCEIKEIPSQLDFYRMALGKEKESIDLYTDFLSKAANDGDKKLFQYLIKQEEQHYAILEDLVILLGHTEDWAESADFGKRREEY